MNNLNVYEILGYGVIGLGFLLALLAYRLLAREQEGDPRPTMIKAIRYFMIFSVVLCVIGFVAEIFRPGNGTDQDALSEEAEQWKLRYEESQASYEELEREHDRLSRESFALKELSDQFSEFFEVGGSKTEFRSVIASLVGTANEVRSYKNHYAFKLFEIERMIPEFGTNINASIAEERTREVYVLIQNVLKGAGFYNGEVNGDQGTTYDAIVNFQVDFNEREKEEIFHPEDDYGYFGYRTLEAIRSTYRR